MSKKVICPNFGRCTSRDRCPHRVWHSLIKEGACLETRCSKMGREIVVAVTENRLDFGPWEQIFYGEFDGGRRKRVLVKIIGD